jgi:hypothetical protein
MRKERDPKIDNDEFFIVAPRFQNHIDKYLDSNPNGTSSANIAKMMCMTIQEVERRYAKALLALRNLLD